MRRRWASPSVTHGGLAFWDDLPMRSTETLLSEATGRSAMLPDDRRRRFFLTALPSGTRPALECTLNEVSKPGLICGLQTSMRKKSHLIRTALRYHSSHAVWQSGIAAEAHRVVNRAGSGLQGGEQENVL